MSHSSSQIINCPKFATGLFFELRAGFFLPSLPDFDLNNSKYRSDPNSWVRLVALLESAKEGDFSDSHLVTDIISGNLDPSLWHAWATFVGYACPLKIVRKAIDEVFEEYSSDPPNFVYDHISSMITATQQLSLISIVIDWCIQKKGSELGETLSFRLGQLLEPEWSEISSGDLHGNDLIQYVHDIKRRLCSDEKSKNVAIRGGELFSPENSANRMLDIVKSNDGDFEDFIDDRMIFEATTGINLTSCFKDENVLPFRAERILEKVLLRGDLKHFQPGERYFFGHLIPLD